MTASAAVLELTEDDVIPIPGKPGQFILRTEYEAWLAAPVDDSDHHTRAAAEYDDLTRAAALTPPPCTNDLRYVAEDLDHEHRLQIADTCARCGLRSLCDAYASKARPTVGIWAGLVYRPTHPLPNIATHQGEPSAFT
ncbi:hypothetical protein [Microbacterium sp.]|uniref:hypothetical protein n=1 Tax=Microbacterium sp. TaxID=51671 RepID=UPI003C277B16